MPILPAPRRILVKEVNWLGDLVMSLPALWAVRCAYPQARLSVLVHSPLASFFDGVAWVDEVLPYIAPRGGSRALRDLWEIVYTLRVRRFDLGVAFPRSFSAALWMYLGGVRQRAGVRAQGRSWLLTRAVPVATNDPTRHQRHAWLELVQRTVAAPTPTSPPPLSPHPAHVRRMRAVLEERLGSSESVVGLAPGAAYGPAKQWPEAHWRELANHLTAKGKRIVFLGTSAERGLCERLLQALPQGQATVLAGETSVGELQALLSLLCAYAGNDSGASHLAAALGVPTVTIFGSTNPTRTAPQGARTQVLYEPPPCSPCLARTCRFGHYECLTAIQPQHVIGAFATLAVL